MSLVEHIESGKLPAELTEALRTFLSRQDVPYLDVPGTDGPGICVGTSLADMRRYIEAEYEGRQSSRPKVPVNYSISGRRKLPDPPQYRDAATQTEGRPDMSMTAPAEPGTPGSAASPRKRRRGTPSGTQIESAPEAGTRGRKGRGRPCITQVICSSSSDTDRQPYTQSAPRSHRPPSQGLPLAEPSAAASMPAGSPPWAVRREEGAISLCAFQKRKADSNLPRPAKRPTMGAGSKPDFSDADDEDDLNRQGAVGEGASVRSDETPATSPPAPQSPVHSLRDASTDPTEADDGSARAPAVSVVPSSQDSSSQSGSDNQSPVAKSEKTAKAALHNLETATGIHVPQKYRSAMVEHSLALGKRQTLENFRQACRYWRDEHAARSSAALTLFETTANPGPALSSDTRRHPALDRFSHAYHAAQRTVVHRAVLDVLYRADLAHLHDVYLSTLEALSPFSAQPRDTRNARPRELFDLRARIAATDQMYWACYPQHQGKPRSCNKSLSRKFSSTLEHAAKWHALRAEFGFGMLPLVPRGANSWLETLPFEAVPIYLRLVTAVNPVAVAMAGMMQDWVLCLWGRAAPPRQLLLLEHLESVDEILFKASPLKLLEGVDVGYVRSTQELQVGRAVTVPVGIDEDDIAALDAVFSSGNQVPLGHGSYLHSPSFHASVNFS